MIIEGLWLKNHWFSRYGSCANINQSKISFPTVLNMTCFAGKKFRSYKLLTSSITWPKFVAPSKFRVKILKKTTIPRYKLLTQLAVLWKLFTITSFTKVVLIIYRSYARQPFLISFRNPNKLVSRTYLGWTRKILEKKAKSANTFICFCGVCERNKFQRFACKKPRSEICFFYKDFWR